MRTVAIVQARMSSSRLPGKVLKVLAGKPVLYHIYERLSECRLLDAIVFATSTEETDNPIALFCEEVGAPCFRGDLADVLDRYYQTALKNDADVIVRITGDCPVIDPVVVDAVVAGFLSGNYDFYGLGGEFPDGLDCTVFSFKAIQKAWKESILLSDREHVGPYIERNPEVFKSGVLELFVGLSSMRWTLDEPQDFELLSLIYTELYKQGTIFYTHQIVEFLKINPSLLKINSNIIRNEGYLKSLLAEGINLDD